MLPKKGRAMEEVSKMIIAWAKDVRRHNLSDVQEQSFEESLNSSMHLNNSFGNNDKQLNGPLAPLEKPGI